LSFVPKFLTWFAKSNVNKKYLFFKKTRATALFLIKHLVVGKQCGWEKGHKVE
jgi:membrane protein CcdC involved in cytochrome C biogenesis